MAVTIPQLADRLLSDLNAPKTPQMYAAAESWIIHENGVNNNILGVTSNGHLNTYSSPFQGIDAAAALLKTGNFGYDKITQQAKAGNSIGFLTAVAQSGWNAPTHYGLGPQLRGGTNSLIVTYNDILFHGMSIPPANSNGTGQPIVNQNPVGTSSGSSGSTSTGSGNFFQSNVSILGANVPLPWPNFGNIIAFGAIVLVGIVLITGGFLISRPGQSATKAGVNIVGTGVKVAAA